MAREREGVRVRVLHGVWSRDTLMVWAEGATVAGRDAGAHPFAEDVSGLRASVAEIGVEAVSADPVELTLTLPEADGVPLRSHTEPPGGPGSTVGPGDAGTPAPLAGGPADTTGPPPGDEGTRTRATGFGTWRVPALALSAAEADLLLAALDEPDTSDAAGGTGSGG
ncbi:hypothetical protein DSY14_24730, partial [Nocardiopsis sp. MG754419]|nr:hypothetical protein [Nocardiopsis sp. MG754419]